VEFNIILGMKEEEARTYLRVNFSQMEYSFSYTIDPYQQAGCADKRVIRVKKLNNTLYILVGYFRSPDYIL
jgi:hypothetical protein